MTPATLDYSMFDTSDLVNIILQRSDVLFDIPKRGQLIKAWSNGDAETLPKIASEKGALLAQRALTDIYQEFEDLAPVFDGWRPRTVADIGCGYAFFDFIAAQSFDAKVHLIDMETNDHRHFGYGDQGSAYSNLQKAVEFLKRNGVSPSMITATNPQNADVTQIGPVDLAVSFLACGFHFPVDTYMPFFDQNVVPGGRIILDLRNAKREKQLATLSTIGETSILSESNNRARILVVKGA